MCSRIEIKYRSELKKFTFYVTFTKRTDYQNNEGYMYEFYNWTRNPDIWISFYFL